MPLALRILGWAGVVLLAWTLLSVAALGYMYARGWLDPERSERIRRHEEAAEAAGSRESRGRRPLVTRLRSWWPARPSSASSSRSPTEDEARPDQDR